MPIQGLQFNINSQAEVHRTFQATGSFIAYNPNDGVCYLALDRTASSLNFDHKLPSQSGGRFPGPINAYLSIYYQDQSGSGVGGQISIYGDPKPLEIPYFWSIGRAIQSQVTSLDINQGSQPPNPPVAVDRIWADNQGLIHHLHSNGVDTILVDPLQTGVVSTQMIAANATQQLLGSQSGQGFSTTTVSTWVATPLSATVTTSGGMLRMFYSLGGACSTAGNSFYTGLGWSGVVQVQLTLTKQALAAATANCAAEFYAALPAGTYTIGVWINQDAGSFQFNGPNYLYINEQKR